VQKFFSSSLFLHRGGWHGCFGRTMWRQLREVKVVVEINVILALSYSRQNSSVRELELIIQGFPKVVEYEKLSKSDVSDLLRVILNSKQKGLPWHFLAIPRVLRNLVQS
jgi:hypothetical protein